MGERVPVIWLPDAQRPDRQGVGAVVYRGESDGVVVDRRDGKPEC